MQKISDVLNQHIRIKSMIILFIISALSSFADIAKTGLTTAVLGFLFSILYTPILIYLIVCIRGTEKKYKVKDSYVIGELGVWGYVWRAFIISFLSAIMSILTFKMLFGVWNSPRNILLNVSVSTLMIFFMPIIAWLVFSSDRKGHLSLAIKAIRGY